MNKDEKGKSSEIIIKNKYLYAFKLFTKMISWSLIVILVVFGLFLLFIFVSSRYAKKNNIYNPFGLYTIISPSMTPNINVYDVVFVMKTDSEKIKVGDVITFYSANPYLQGTPVTHRVLKKEAVSLSYRFSTKGDANAVEDTEIIYEKDLLGKVYFKIPSLGRIQLWLLGKKSLFMLVLLPVVLILVYDFYKILKLYLLKQQIKDEKTKKVEEPKKEEVKELPQEELDKIRKHKELFKLGDYIKKNKDKKPEIIEEQSKVKLVVNDIKEVKQEVVKTDEVKKSNVDLSSVINEAEIKGNKQSNDLDFLKERVVLEDKPSDIIVIEEEKPNDIIVIDDDDIEKTIKSIVNVNIENTKNIKNIIDNFSQMNIVDFDYTTNEVMEDKLQKVLQKLDSYKVLGSKYERITFDSVKEIEKIAEVSNKNHQIINDIFERIDFVNLTDKDKKMVLSKIDKINFDNVKSAVELTQVFDRITFEDVKETVNPTITKLDKVEFSEVQIPKVKKETKAKKKTKVTVKTTRVSKKQKKIEAKSKKKQKNK